MQSGTGPVINKAGKGDLRYQDLSLCPNCSFANALTSTLVVELKSLAQGVATGKVTATSDPKRHVGPSRRGALRHLGLLIAPVELGPLAVKMKIAQRPLYGDRSALLVGPLAGQISDVGARVH